jgi:hypothetical protein
MEVMTVIVPPEKCGHQIGLFAKCQRPVNHEGEHSLALAEEDIPPRMKYA